MSNLRNELARSVTQALFAGERSIDCAVADVARLPGSIATARLEAQLPFGTGQGALSDAAEALNLMIRARHHMARAHQRLREAGTEIGLGVTAGGDIIPCPELEQVFARADEAQPASAPLPHVRLVA